MSNSSYVSFVEIQTLSLWNHNFINVIIWNPHQRVGLNDDEIWAMSEFSQPILLSSKVWFQDELSIPNNSCVYVWKWSVNFAFRFNEISTEFLDFFKIVTNWLISKTFKTAKQMSHERQNLSRPLTIVLLLSTVLNAWLRIPHSNRPSMSSWLS